MSGGSLDYVYSRIEEAADRIQGRLANIKLRYDNGIYEEVADYYRKENPDEPSFKDDKTFTDALLKQLQAALVCMRNAVIYAKEAEWWYSSDTGPETFLLETRKKVKGNREAKGIV